MSATRSGLVDIVREFFTAHELMRRLFARHREGALRFEELEALIGDDERSVLFRLKERCHASFRARGDESPTLHREALFDLAVGSLFHEAMKFRESFYQREVYGPQVEALRSEADPEEAALFDEFSRIEEGVSARLEEGLAETEGLLARSADQLKGLLAEHGEDPVLARYLVGNAKALESALGCSLEELFTRVYGRVANGFLCAGCSLLRSGYYAEAVRVLRMAAERGGDAGEIERLVTYARGMQAYLARDYGESIARLSDWADGVDLAASELSGPAHDAVARVGQLAFGAERQRIVREAAALLARLAPAAGTR